MVTFNAKAPQCILHQKESDSSVLGSGSGVAFNKVFRKYSKIIKNGGQAMAL